MQRRAIAIGTAKDSVEKMKLGYLLVSLLHQKSKFDIHIWDEGKMPIFRNKHIELMLDILEKEGHTYNYYRRIPSRGVSHQRYGLFKIMLEACYEKFLLLDDDVVLIGDAADHIFDEADELTEMYGYIKGLKVECNQAAMVEWDTTSKEWDSSVVNDEVHKKWAEENKMYPAFVGDFAFILLNSRALETVNWESILHYPSCVNAGEDLISTIQMSHKFPCFSTPRANAYHMGADRPRWHWMDMSDQRVIEELVRLEIPLEHIKKVFTYMKEDVWSEWNQPKPNLQIRE